MTIKNPDDRPLRVVSLWTSVQKEPNQQGLGYIHMNPDGTMFVVTEDFAIRVEVPAMPTNKDLQDL